MQGLEAAKRIAIVGNGPVADGAGPSIDACDIVMRFNDPVHAVEAAGSKTDILFLVNSGKSMQARVSDPGFVRSPYFARAPRIVLPYHPSIVANYHPQPNLLSLLKGRRADWTSQAIDVFGRAGKEIVVLPPQFYDDCCSELGIAEGDRRRLFPSTGFIGIHYALERYAYPEWRVELHGFSWEGWKRHAWGQERDWISRRIAEGKLRFMEAA